MAPALKLDAQLAELVAALDAVPVIVTFDALPRADELESLGIQVRHSFAAINAVAATASLFALGALAQRSDVTRIEYDGEIRTAESRRRMPTPPED